MNRAYYNCVVFNNKTFCVVEKSFAFVSFLSANYTLIFQQEICLQMGMDQLTSTDQKYSFSYTTE